MKRIEDLLNSLLTKPEDKTGLLNGLSSGATPKTNSGKTGSFSQVLDQVTQANNVPENNGSVPSQITGAGSANNPASAQVGSQTSQAPQAASNAFSETISQTSITITETLRNASVDQVRQAEQTLQGLMAGLLNLLQGLSSSNTSQPTSQEQGQTLNAALGLSPADLKTISNMLQPFVQNLPEGQNPLLLNSDQQARLLAQMVQQMMSAQQVLFGTPNLQGQGNDSNQVQTGSVQGIGQVTGAAGSVSVLQMNFSDLQVGIRQDQGTQASQVLINLESFKMSATFIQEGPQNLPSSSGQGLAPLNPSALTGDMADKLQAALNGAQFNPASASTNQQIQPTIPTNVQNPGLMKNFKELVQLLLQSGVTQAALTSFMNKAQENPNSAIPNGGAAILQAGVNPTKLNNRPELPQVNLTTISSEGSKPLAPIESLMPPVESSNKVSSQAPSKVSGNLTSQLNEIASRLAGGKDNGVLPGNNASSSQNPLPTGTAQVGPTEKPPTVQVPLSSQEVQTPQELQNIVIGNDNSSKLNAVSLHATQGSLTFGDIHPLSNQVYTLDQVTGSKAATQLNSPVPAVVSGNPSVPQNAQTVPPVETMIKGHVIQNEITAALDQIKTNLGPVEANANPSTTNTPTVPQTVNSNGPIVENQSFATNIGRSLNLNVAPENSQVLPTPSTNVSTNPLVRGSAPKNDIFNGNSQPNVGPNNGGVVSQSRPETLPHTVMTPPPALFQGPEVQNEAAQALGTIPAPPTATTPLVSSSVVVGEGIKNELLPQIAHGITNLNQNNVPGAFQPDQTIKAQAPGGVTPVVSVTPVNTQSQVQTVTDKAAPKDTASLNLASLLTTSGSGSTQPEDSGKFAQGLNNLSNGPRFSLDSNQLFNLVSTQLTSQMTQARNVSRLNFQLMPESLGKVTVQMALVDQSLSARIIVSNPEVREAVQAHLVDLRASLAQAGLQIDQLQVQVQGGGANLLAQYYQYQQEGSNYRNPVFTGVSEVGGAENIENSGVLAGSGRSLTLVDYLA